jgi:hypothetical protein
LTTSAYKVIAFLLTLAVVCAPGLCNCIDPPKSAPAGSHDCCKHSEGDPKPAPVKEHDHSENCNHCNPTLKSAVAEQGQQPVHSLDAACELPSGVLHFVSPVQPVAASPFSGDIIPPLLRDLFHMRASLLN